ncbi:nicotinamide-nucleotide amidohydrolase family protein [Companilactobacillus mishanensis]|uniref:Nicotinamide-nucleotide amidohydrolase family protein n=1 Tax=Companilactobacillus mishanensis TaxID=2486008 RepID=A0A5P0ZFR3_9LACO|nr:nicotinamide-nucleotide amidohydrolase family protein [Companilactobacillus mishanensis]MQS45643.1 nicotinamide-nucleotide amidohydrolase family protein [Companilactobacillus mishanensis]MQS51890.1 nicotinamide-nucleotide amidohydrolase family protein [Companilactobacillus mishanensis]MQS88995.1 nicotinamide-nucleotide amidohydrolase family protein [Companilactobacillus mishanensis]
MDRERFEDFREKIEAADFEAGIPAEYQTIPQDTVNMLLLHSKTITAAESVTAGLFQSTIADVPGASEIYEGGYITYSDKMKEKLLRIPNGIIDTHTVVSAPVAQEMAESTAKLLDKDIGMGVTGVAGPEQLEGNRVGTVFIGVYDKDTDVVEVKEFHFEGSRNAIRRKAVISAFVLVQRIA